MNTIYNLIMEHSFLLELNLILIFLHHNIIKTNLEIQLKVLGFAT